MVLVGQDLLSREGIPLDRVLAQLREDERVSKFSQRVYRYNWGWAGFELRTPCSLDRTGSSTDGRWAHLDSTIPR